MVCAKCGRNLRTERSRELGYGPVCYRMVYGAPAPRIKRRPKGKPADPFDYDVPGQISMDDYLRDIGQ